MPVAMRPAPRTKWERQTGVPNGRIIAVYERYQLKPDALSPGALAKDRQELERFKRLLGSSYAAAPMLELSKQVTDLRKKGLINLGIGVGPRKGYKRTCQEACLEGIKIEGDGQGAATRRRQWRVGLSLLGPRIRESRNRGIGVENE